MANGSQLRSPQETQTQSVARRQPPSTLNSTAICWRSDLVAASCESVQCSRRGVTETPARAMDLIRFEPMLVRTVFWFSSLPLPLANSKQINTTTQQISRNLFERKANVFSYLICVDKPK